MSTGIGDDGFGFVTGLNPAQVDELLGMVADGGEAEEIGPLHAHHRWRTDQNNAIDFGPSEYHGGLCEGPCAMCKHAHVHDDTGRCLSGEIVETTTNLCPCPYPHGVQEPT